MEEKILKEICKELNLWERIRVKINPKLTYKIYKKGVRFGSNISN